MPATEHVSRTNELREISWRMILIPAIDVCSVEYGTEYIGVTVSGMEFGDYMHTIFARQL